MIYAGFSNVNPLTALKEVASGKPTSVRNEGVDPASFSMPGVSGGGIQGFVEGGIAQADYADAVSGEGLPTLPRAAEKFANDRYSQAKRWQPGYSDCSSFVGKSLKQIGIKPPGGSTTTTYLLSKEWTQIPASDVMAGDLACAINHVAICYGNGYAIGQQSTRRNVQRGKVSDLMYGNTPFVYLRYVGGTAAKPKSANA